MANEAIKDSAEQHGSIPPAKYSCRSAALDVGTSEKSSRNGVSSTAWPGYCGKPDLESAARCDQDLPTMARQSRLIRSGWLVSLSMLGILLDATLPLHPPNCPPCG